MTILTSSFYSVLQYYNNHHPHIEDMLYYTIEQKFCQILIRDEYFLPFFFVYSNAIFEIYF